MCYLDWVCYQSTSVTATCVTGWKHLKDNTYYQGKDATLGLAEKSIVIWRYIDICTCKSTTWHEAQSFSVKTIRMGKFNPTIKPNCAKKCKCNIAFCHFMVTWINTRSFTSKFLLSCKANTNLLRPVHILSRWNELAPKAWPSLDTASVKNLIWGSILMSPIKYWKSSMFCQSIRS
jgi:hypothetical protein